MLLQEVGFDIVSLWGPLKWWAVGILIVVGLVVALFITVMFDRRKQK